MLDKIANWRFAEGKSYCSKFPEHTFAVEITEKESKESEVRLLGDIEITGDGEERVELFDKQFVLNMNYIVLNEFIEGCSLARELAAGGITFDYEDNKDDFQSVYDCLLKNTFGEKVNYDDYGVIVCSEGDFNELYDILKPGRYIFIFRD